jgi:hypothetical protein
LLPQPVGLTQSCSQNSFHPLQTATFFCGYFLVIGSYLLYCFVSLSLRIKTLAFEGLIINVVFTAIVFINYIIQTTYIPYLATNFPAVSKSFYLFSPWQTLVHSRGFRNVRMGWYWAFVYFYDGDFGTNKIDRTLKSFLQLTHLQCRSAIMTSIDMNGYLNSGLVSLVVWNTLVFVIDLVC